MREESQVWCGSAWTIHTASVQSQEPLYTVRRACRHCHKDMEICGIPLIPLEYSDTNNNCEKIRQSLLRECMILLDVGARESDVFQLELSDCLSRYIVMHEYRYQSSVEIGFCKGKTLSSII
jgi:hypothetical protein